MTSAAALQQVHQVFIAYYNRPADPAGLHWWAEQLDTEGGNINAIIEAFANSPESQELYQGVNNNAFIDSIYQAVLGRHADAAGLTFYQNKLAAGELTRATLALDVLNGAVTGDDKALIDNKTAFSQQFVEALDSSQEQATYSGHDAAAMARLHMSQIEEDTTTGMLPERAQLAAQNLLDLSAEPTAAEQLMLERLNAERADPAGYATEYGLSDLNEGVPVEETISSAAKQPLAFAPRLTEAARDHSQWMLDTDTFSHTGAGGTDAGDRISVTGYDWRGWGETWATPAPIPHNQMLQPPAWKSNATCLWMKTILAAVTGLTCLILTGPKSVWASKPASIPAATPTTMPSWPPRTLPSPAITTNTCWG